MRFPANLTETTFSSYDCGGYRKYGRGKDLLYIKPFFEG